MEGRLLGSLEPADAGGQNQHPQYWLKSLGQVTTTKTQFPLCKMELSCPFSRATAASPLNLISTQPSLGPGVTDAQLFLLW